MLAASRAGNSGERGRGWFGGRRDLAVRPDGGDAALLLLVAISGNGLSLGGSGGAPLPGSAVTTMAVSVGPAEKGDPAAVCAGGTRCLANRSSTCLCSVETLLSRLRLSVECVVLTTGGRSAGAGIRRICGERAFEVGCCCA